MDFTIFNNSVEILDRRKGDKFREEYIHQFVNTNKNSFQEKIQLRRKFIDGYCYIGYLWDYLTNPVFVEETYITKVAENLNSVYVFWDIHSCERIFIKDYWKFGKDTVLKLDIKTLLAGEEYLPEDIYIFDEGFTWTLIKTHEEIERKRFCLISGDIY